MKFSNLVRLAVGVSFLLFGAYTLASPPAVSYHLLKKVPLAAAPGGSEYFDYLTVDSAARRVYVSHGTEVVVLNADDYTVVGTIGGLQRCHGVIVIKERGKGYITDGEAQKVVIFDLKTLKVTGEVKTNQPDTDSIISAWSSPPSMERGCFTTITKKRTTWWPLIPTLSRSRRDGRWRRKDRPSRWRWTPRTGGYSPRAATPSSW